MERLAVPGTLNTLKDAFGIRPGEVISLVGAGGKSTLMFALAQELTAPGRVVVTTTTTKIFIPSPLDAPGLFLSRNYDEIVRFILTEGLTFGHVTIAAERIAGTEKLKGIKPAWVSRLSQLKPVAYTILEADGAAGRPLKAPNPAFEPVIPKNTSLLIPVVGIDALGARLTEETVFRSEIAAGLAGVPIGNIITADCIALLLTHPSGMMKGCPAPARISPFINKTDLHHNLRRAIDLASRILAEKHPQIDRVVLGRARFAPAVTDVITPHQKHGAWREGKP